MSLFVIFIVCWVPFHQYLVVIDGIQCHCLSYSSCVGCLSISILLLLMAFNVTVCHIHRVLGAFPSVSCCYWWHSMSLFVIFIVCWVPFHQYLVVIDGIQCHCLSYSSCVGCLSISILLLLMACNVTVCHIHRVLGAFPSVSCCY